jgi:3',5'-nucleoside bisphosphate phosphatase
MIDLQNHTIASDGELTGEELVDLAISKNLSAIAITDHDSIASNKAAIEYSKDKNIEVISGVELSCDDPLFTNPKIDVLGLFVDYKNRDLLDLIKQISNERDNHKSLIIDKLNELAYEVNYDEVKKTVQGTFGKPHIAKFLIKKYPNKFSTVKEVFKKLLDKGKPAYVKPGSRVSVKDAVKIIKEAGGLAILAHPGIYPPLDSVKLIDYFIDNGGDGIETYYPYHIICPEYMLDKKSNKKMIEFYKSIVKSKKILESGGNDHHDNERPTMGEVEIPEEIIKNLKKSLKR